MLSVLFRNYVHQSIFIDNLSRVRQDLIQTLEVTTSNCFHNRYCQRLTVFRKLYLHFLPFLLSCSSYDAAELYQLSQSIIHHHCCLILLVALIRMFVAYFVCCHWLGSNKYPHHPLLLVLDPRCFLRDHHLTIPFSDWLDSSIHQALAMTKDPRLDRNHHQNLAVPFRHQNSLPDIFYDYMHLSF